MRANAHNFESLLSPRLPHIQVLRDAPKIRGSCLYEVTVISSPALILAARKLKQ